MTRTELFEIAHKKGHQVIYTELTENDCLSVELDGECYVALQDDLPEVDEVEMLAHELGHCEYSGFYSILTPLNTRGRIEYRTKKWQYSKLVPLGELRAAIRSGITAPWELAEHFNVSEALLYGACEYYQNACGAIMDLEAM